MSRIRPLILSSFAFAAITPLFATQSDNHGLHAVPPPGPVVIDGRLGDWDLSGRILICYDLESLRDVYSVEAAMMYDAQHCYIALRWKDPKPLGNSHDPYFQASKGWAGDAVQLRLKTDRISHVTAWYFAPKNLSFMHLDYGKSLTEPFGGGERRLFPVDGWKLDGGAEQAFLAEADGKGYVQEIKLPWSLITTSGTTPAEFACGFEVLWGEADWPVHRYSDNLAVGHSSREFFWTAHRSWGPVLLEKTGMLKLPKPPFLAAFEEAASGDGVVPVPYSTPKAGRVTLAIDDAEGRRVRNLTAAQPREAGANQELWDGLDDAGRPVPPGQYRLRGLVHDGIRANWLMSFSSPGNPPWASPDGKGAFYGDHSAPQASAAGGDFVALACPMGEAGQHLIGCDLDGQRLWGLPNRTAFDGGHISLATDGKILWVANEAKQSTIYRVDLGTGRYAPWSRTMTDSEGRTTPVLDLLVSEQPGWSADRSKGMNLRAIAMRDGKLAACLLREGKVLVLDGTSGAVERTIVVEHPRSVAWQADGVLAVLSGAQVLRIARDGAVTPLGEAMWQDASYLTSDAAGNLYLSVRGERQQIQVLSPSGSPLRTIGVAGGRPGHGRYLAEGMRNPGQPAIDSRGNLWVPEETFNPKRTSIWNAASGVLVKELVGTTSYAGSGSLNPDDPTMAFSEQTVFRLDLEKGTSQPVWSVGGGGHGHASGSADDDLFPARVHELTNRTITRNGMVYVFTTDSARGADELHCTLFDGKQWRSAAHIGVVAHRDFKDQDRKYQHPVFAGHHGEIYAWADADGDGRVQQDELTFSKTVGGEEALELRSSYWGQLPDPEGAVPYRTQKADRLVLFSIAGFTACGAPRYDLAAAEVISVEQPILEGGSGMIMGGHTGLIHLNQNPLVTVDSKGRVVGTYPNPHVSVHGSHHAKAARPGYLIGPSSILGTADLGGESGPVWYLNGNLGENFIFTADGLWVQSLFKDCRGGFDTPNVAVRGMPVDTMTAGGESFGGNFIQTRDGRHLLVASGTDARIIELSGLKSLKRFSGAFIYTPEHWQAAKQAAEEKAAKANQPKRWRVPRAGSDFVIDGKATEWPELTNEQAPAVLIGEDVKRPNARVGLRWSPTHLHLAWRVRDDHDKPRNIGQDERLLFKSGDAVDLMLIGGDPAGLRLLLTSFSGQPTAVLYEKHVAGTPEAARVGFSSPWRTIHFDRVTRPSDVTVAFEKIGGGWFVEAQVPWSRLGLAPEAGQELRADVGVLKADRGGTTTVGRHYWSNGVTNLVNDIPGEAELTPKLWGTLVLE